MLESLAAIRKARRMSQTDLAAKVGVSRNTIVNWESGKSEPLAGQLFAVCDALGVSPDVMLDWHDGGGVSYADQRQALINDVFESLNEVGKTEAAKRIYELIQLPAYSDTSGEDTGIQAKKVS